MRRLWFKLGVAILFVTAANAATAQVGPWPNQTVRIIAPFPGGGTADVLGRLLADHLSARFGKPFIVDNRTGAGGMIGSQFVSSVAPDGYTLVISGNASHIVAPAFAPKALYDGLKDFTHIGFLGGSPVGLVINPSLPVNSYPELIKYARSSPSPMDYTSSGIGTNGFLFGEELSAKEGMRLNHIPYKGGGPAIADLVAGHVKIATMTFSTTTGQVRAGALKALAVSSNERLANFSEIPTFRELGYPDMVSLSWFALSGPPGLPRDIVDSLNREVAVLVQRPEVKARLDRDAIEVKLMSAAETTKYFEAELTRWAPLARALRAKGYKSN